MDPPCTLKEPHFGVGDVVAAGETNHGSYVGVRSYRSTPYGTYEEMES